MPIQFVKTYQKCSQCNGTGVQYAGGGETGSGPFPCLWPGCEDGYLEIGLTALEPSLENILDKCNDILDKCNDVLDKCNDILEKMEKKYGTR